MQTVSTKLDKQTANKFVELCNSEGKCQSEFLRDLIEQVIDVDDIDEEVPRTTGKVIDVIPEPIVEIVPSLENVRIE